MPVTVTAPDYEGFANRAARASLARQAGHPSEPPLTAASAQWCPAAEGATVHYLVPERRGLSACTSALTPRERELVTHLVQGLCNQELAEALGVSVNTVKQHLKGIYAKLGVRTRAELVAQLLGS